MFLSNSTLIIQVNNLGSTDNLKDHYFFEEYNSQSQSRKFYSINFYSDDKDSGEIHYTESFENGNMNLINFLRKGDFFYLFTSSIQHTKFFKKILVSMCSGEDLSFDIIKLSQHNKNLPLLNINNFKVLEADGVFGVKGILSFEKENYLIKIYTNGIITFSLTNNRELVEEVIATSLNIISKYEDFQ